MTSISQPLAAEDDSLLTLDLSEETASKHSSTISPSKHGFLLTWLLFLVYSFCHAPIPSVNEPHYLTKAKHYWNPDWCAGDFFLESSNTHLVYYQTVGWLTQFFSFDTTTVIARLIGYGLLAFGWNSLATRLVQHRLAGCLSAVFFLLLASIANLSGEWVVGGIEAKVFSYGFLLIGYAAAMSDRWTWSGISFGLAVAFHPLVGLWNVVAFGLTLGIGVAFPGRRMIVASVASRLKQPRVFLALIAFVAISMWGIWPALNVVSSQNSRDSFYANYVQVFHRLAHHLDPMMIPISRYLAYTCLTICTAIALGWLNWKPEAKFFARVVFSSGLIVIVGCLLGLRSLDLTTNELAQIPFFRIRMTLLKFYPFRLFDALMPMLAAFVLSHLVVRSVLLIDVPRWKRVAAVCSIYLSAILLSWNVGSNKHLEEQYVSDWLDVCHWIDTNLPNQVVVMTPKDAWSFKWHAQRPEFVFGKDCPQDADGVIEWNQRLLFMRDWGIKNFNTKAGYTRAACLELANNSFQPMTHIVTRRLGPLDLPVIYRNNNYTVYEVDR